MAKSLWVLGAFLIQQGVCTVNSKIIIGYNLAENENEARGLFFEDVIAFQPGFAIDEIILMRVPPDLGIDLDGLGDKHPDHVVGWHGDLTELIGSIGRMRYDVMSEFTRLMAAEIQRQSDGDLARHRPKLAAHLATAAEHFRLAESALADASKICQPFMS